MRGILEFLFILAITACIMLMHLSLQLHVPVLELAARFLAVI